MSFLGGVGSPAAPNVLSYYDFSAASFSIPAMSASSPYPVTGSTRTFQIATAKNVAPVANTDDTVLASIWQAISFLVTTNSTDTYTVEIEASTDGGSTWATITNTGNTIAANKQGKFSSVMEGSFLAGTKIDITGAITNPIQLRLAFLDATSPTTDIFSVSNLRATAALLVMK